MNVRMRKSIITIGSGFIASSFKNFSFKDVVLFASGVSNSSCTNQKEFEKEKKLLIKTIKKYQKKKIIYFSTCSIMDDSRKKNLYQKHKILIEDYIKKNCKSYLIFRLPEVIGKSKNKNTLINYLFNNIRKNTPIHTSKYTFRNLVDIHDIKKIVKTCLKLNLFNKTIIIANNTMYSLVNLINKIELILQKKAIIIKSEKFNNKSFVINVKSYKKLYQKSKVTFGKNYLTEKLNKYYK